jgi:hypothetical protein
VSPAETSLVAGFDGSTASGDKTGAPLAPLVGNNVAVSTGGGGGGKGEDVGSIGVTEELLFATSLAGDAETAGAAGCATFGASGACAGGFSFVMATDGLFSLLESTVGLAGACV